MKWARYLLAFVQFLLGLTLLATWILGQYLQTIGNVR
jgi:hypothetical protein